jgi:hypothetical protein
VKKGTEQPIEREHISNVDHVEMPQCILFLDMERKELCIPDQRVSTRLWDGNSSGTGFDPGMIGRCVYHFLPVVLFVLRQCKVDIFLHLS